MIVNTILNITDEDVTNCEDKIQLLEWFNDIELQKLGLRQKIQKDYNNKMSCDKAKSLSYALQIQTILNEKIKTRLTTLKEGKIRAFDALFVSQVRIMYPEIFKELKEAIMDELNNS